MDDNRKRQKQHEIAGHTRRSKTVDAEEAGYDWARTRAKGPRRDPAKEHLWRRRLAEQPESGLSVRAYCRRGGFSEPLFYQWKREIARRDSETLVMEDGGSGRKKFANKREDIAATNSRELARSSGTAARPSLKDSRSRTGSARSRSAFVELRPTDNLAVTPLSSRPLGRCSSSNAPGACEFSARAAVASRSLFPEHAIEIVLRNGRALRVWRGFDPDLLLELATVLESEAAPC